MIASLHVPFSALFGSEYIISFIFSWLPLFPSFLPHPRVGPKIVLENVLLYDILLYIILQCLLPIADQHFPKGILGHYYRNYILAL